MPSASTYVMIIPTYSKSERFDVAYIYSCTEKYSWRFNGKKHPFLAIVPQSPSSLRTRYNMPTRIHTKMPPTIGRNTRATIKKTPRRGRESWKGLNPGHREASSHVYMIFYACLRMEMEHENIWNQQPDIRWYSDNFCKASHEADAHSTTFPVLSSLDLLGSGLQLRSYFPPFWRRHTHTHALVWVGIERPRHWMVSYCCVLKYSKKLQNHVGLTHPSASSPVNLSSATNKATEVASATDVLHKASCLPHVQGMPNEMCPSQRSSDGL